MSALGGKADMLVCGCLLSRSLLGVKRTCIAALHESAFDPKRTWVDLNNPFQTLEKDWYAVLELRGLHETARFHQSHSWFGGCLPVRGRSPGRSKATDRRHSGLRGGQSGCTTSYRSLIEGASPVRLD